MSFPRNQRTRSFGPVRWLVFFLILAVFAVACSRPETVGPRARLDGFPRVVLWAWERPEDLEFVGPEKYGVAFLAQTLTLSGERVIFTPRRQPLNVSPETKLIAVTRVAARKKSGGEVALSDAQRDELVALILKTLELKNVSAVQIDFDVLVSEREFYRGLLATLRERLPDHVPLSITALSSFCLGDRWMQGLPVDEIVPMVFRLGPDERQIKEHLASGGDFREPLCRAAYGISLDEQFDLKFDYTRRIYVFNPRPWKETDLVQLDSVLKRK